MQLDKEQKRSRWRIAMLQALPAVGLGTYVVGFLATNIHLGKFGIFEFDLISSRYVIVGILYVLFLAFWYYFAGQFLLRMEWDDSGYVEEENTFGSLLLTWIELVFLICVSAALFALIFLGRTEAVFFCTFAFILCVINPWWENLWESKGLCDRFPLGDLLIDPTIRLLAIIVFFITIELNSLGMMLFVHFFAMSIYGRFVFRLLKRYQREKGEYGAEGENLSRMIVHIGVFILLSSTSFGWLQYGHIAPNLGGGQSQTVEVVVVETTVSKSLATMGFSVKPTLKAQLLHEDEGNVFIGVGDKTVQLSRGAIGDVQVFAANSSGWGVYAKRIWAEIRAKWEGIRFTITDLYR